MGEKDQHFKSKIIKFDVPRLSLEGLYKIPFIGLMDWRGKLEEPIIAVAEAGTPEMLASV
jgi:sulfopyruvate decarboxylase TPP-binding subunit